MQGQCLDVIFKWLRDSKLKVKLDKIDGIGWYGASHGGRFWTTQGSNKLSYQLGSFIGSCATVRKSNTCSTKDYLIALIGETGSCLDVSDLAIVSHVTVMLRPRLHMYGDDLDNLKTSVSITEILEMRLLFPP